MQDGELHFSVNRTEVVAVQDMGVFRSPLSRVYAPELP